VRAAEERTAEAIRRFNAIGRRLSQNDVLVILMANLLPPLSAIPVEDAVRLLQGNQAAITAARDACWVAQDVKTRKQPTLFEL
jgi:hypothetical protein